MEITESNIVEFIKENKSIEKDLIQIYIDMVKPLQYLPNQNDLYDGEESPSVKYLKELSVDELEDWKQRHIKYTKVIIHYYLDNNIEFGNMVDMEELLHNVYNHIWELFLESDLELE